MGLKVRGNKQEITEQGRIDDRRNVRKAEIANRRRNLNTTDISEGEELQLGQNVTILEEAISYVSRPESNNNNDVYL